MRALRGVGELRPGARGIAGLTLAAAVLATAGCSQFDAAYGKQEAVVTFSPGTTQSAMLKVRTACSKVPGATAEAIPAGLNGTSGRYDVRYRVDNASDADIARLE